MINNKLPEGDIYELEYKYWPWGKLIDFIYKWIIQNSPDSSYVIDYMCGTGYLLDKLSLERKDLSIEGCSLNEVNIDYGLNNYKNIKLYCKDVFDFIPSQKPSVIIAAGGLHHLERPKQKQFIQKVHSELIEDGYFILGEEVIRHYTNSFERIDSVKELFSYFIDEVLKNKKAPISIRQAVIDLYKIDLFELGEYKSSIDMLLAMVENYFSVESVNKIWPNRDMPFGDVVFVLKKTPF